MSVEKRNFGFIAGKGDVEIYKITNDNGAFVELMVVHFHVESHLVLIDLFLYLLKVTSCYAFHFH